MVRTVPHNETGWVEDLGNLRPWELATAREQAKRMEEHNLRKIVRQVERAVAQRLPSPLQHADVEMILRIAADFATIFRGRLLVPELVRLPNSSRSWHLLCAALRGASYEQLTTALDEANRRAGRNSEGAGPVPAVPIRRSITPDYLVCLEDGRKFKSLKRHLRTMYNMSPEEYRAKWSLPQDYPMVAPNYAKARSALAKQAGLGQGVRQAAIKKP